MEKHYLMFQDYHMQRINLAFFTSSRPEGFCEKVAGFIKKDTLAQMFSYEFCEISKNTFSYRTPLVASSDFYCRLSMYMFCWSSSRLTDHMITA